MGVGSTEESVQTTKTALDSGEALCFLFSFFPNLLLRLLARPRYLTSQLNSTHLHSVGREILPSPLANVFAPSIV